MKRLSTISNYIILEKVNQWRVKSIVGGCQEGWTGRAEDF